MSLQNQQFDTFEEWVSNRDWLMKPHPRRPNELVEPDDADKAIMFDARGRRITNGRDMVLAQKEKTFPVRWLWPEEVGSVALYSIGARGLKYRVEVMCVALNAHFEHGAPLEHVRDTMLPLLDFLRLMDRVGAPAGANALHRQLMQSSLVSEAVVVIEAAHAMLGEVALWRSQDATTWGKLMIEKCTRLKDQIDALS